LVVFFNIVAFKREGLSAIKSYPLCMVVGWAHLDRLNCKWWSRAGVNSHL